MKLLKLEWVGDVDVPELDRVFYHTEILIHPYDKCIRLGRANSSNPPHFAFISMTNSRMISRHHATIEVRDNGDTYEIQDHSINGTFVNYKRLQGRVSLRHGDILCLGHARGSEIQPGKSVSPYKSDLKYKVLFEKLSYEDVLMHESSRTNPSVNVREKLSATPGIDSRRVNKATTHQFLSSNYHELAPSSTNIVSSEAKKRRRSESTWVKEELSSDENENVGSKHITVDPRVSEDDDDLDLSSRGRRKRENSTSRSGRHESKKSKKKSREQFMDQSHSVQSSKHTFSNSSKQSRSSEKRDANSSSSSKKASRSQITNSSSGSHSTKHHHHHSNSSGSHVNIREDKVTSVMGGVGHTSSAISSTSVEACAAKSHCLHPLGSNIDWVACDFCSKWYHMQCVGFSKTAKDQDFYCKRCLKKARRERAAALS